MKFCNHCGVRMEDDDLFCPSCGTKQESVEPVQEVNIQEPVQSSATEYNAYSVPEPEKKTKAPIYIVCGALILILAVAFIFIGKSMISTYNSPIKNAQKAFNSRSDNIEDYFSALPKLYTDIYKDGMKLAMDINEGITDNARDKLEDTIEEQYKELEDIYGKNAKLTYDIKDKEKMKSSELSKIEDFYVSIGELIDKYSLADEDTYSRMAYGMISKKQSRKIAEFAGSTMKKLKKVKVTDGYVLTIDIKIKGREDEYEEEDVEVCVVKMDGKWCIEPLATYTHYVGDIGLDDIIDALPHLDIFN